jgi:rhodanese-related sulfurtransferase
VVDVRDRATHAAGHLPGTVGVEYSDQFTTYVGWLAPWGAELVLLADSRDDLRDATHDLAGIGIEGVGVHVLTPGERLDAQFRRTDWLAYRDTNQLDAAGARTVVDVRQRDEWSAGHLPGAVHVPVQDVERSAPSLPEGELWVHCKSGYRAGIAASLLHRLGRDVVHVDDAWERVGELAIETTPAAA